MMTRAFLLLIPILWACGDPDHDKIESALRDSKAYPSVVEIKMYCDDNETVKSVIANNLVKEGFVTAQLAHTPADMGTALVQFEPKAQPFLVQTNDTLKSFYIQRVRVAEEVFRRISNIRVNTSRTQATVDYTTEFINQTPFLALYKPHVSGEQKRRTFFVKENNVWRWDGKIVRVPKEITFQ